MMRGLLISDMKKLYIKELKIWGGSDTVLYDLLQGRVWALVLLLLSFVFCIYSTVKSALLPMIIYCTAITAKPDCQGGSTEMRGEGTPPEPQDVLDLVADKYLKTINPSTLEEFNGFVDYLERVRKALIVDTQTGSLIITVKCRSLQILQELWDDYCSGLVDEMAQKFLVTKDVLNELNLLEAKITTTILEEEYIACREKLMLFSGELKQLKRLVQARHFCLENMRKMSVKAA